MTDARQLGKNGEAEALKFLEKNGLKLIEQNYHCRQGEIDLIMRDQETLVFIEVRFRKNSLYGSPLETVDHKKQAKIITTTQHYLSRNPSSRQIRFDVIGLSPNRNGIDIQWAKNAFDG